MSGVIVGVVETARITLRPTPNEIITKQLQHGAVDAIIIGPPIEISIALNKGSDVLVPATTLSIEGCRGLPCIGHCRDRLHFCRGKELGK